MGYRPVRRHHVGGVVSAVPSVLAEGVLRYSPGGVHPEGASPWVLVSRGSRHLLPAAACPQFHL